MARYQGGANAGHTVLVDEDEFILRCNASFKLGVHFRHWDKDPETGAPVVSRVALALDEGGCPVTLISDLAAHARALAADPSWHPGGELPELAVSMELIGQGRLAMMGLGAQWGSVSLAWLALRALNMAWLLPHKLMMHALIHRHWSLN